MHTVTQISDHRVQGEH